MLSYFYQYKQLPKQLVGNKTAVEDLMQKEGVFSVRMVGDAMSDAGINNNDMLIADPQEEPFDGSLVVALIEDHMIVRRYFKLERCICLAPENVNYPAIEVSHTQRQTICGVVVKVIRLD